MTASKTYEQAREQYEQAKEACRNALSELRMAQNEVERTLEVLNQARIEFTVSLANDTEEEL